MGEQKRKSPDLQELLDAVRHDRDHVPDKDVEILSIGGHMIGTKGSFVAITGKPKNGKSIFLGAITASAYSAGDIWGIKTTLPEDAKRILYFDTEQSDYDFWVSMGRIAGHIGMQNLPRSIDAFHLRRYSTGLKLPIINHAIMQEDNVGMVIIDGLIDICIDFNSQDESRRIMDWIKFVTEERKILIVAVIHQSKKENYTLGHLGSEVDRYAQSIVQVEKDQDNKFFTMSPVAVRHAPFSPITVKFDGSDFVCVTTEMKAHQEKPAHQRPPNQVPQTEHFYLMNAVMPEAGIIHKELVILIQERKAFSAILAKQFITYWQDQGWVIRKSNGLIVRHQDNKIILLTKNQ